MLFMLCTCNKIRTVCMNILNHRNTIKYFVPCRFQAYAKYSKWWNGWGWIRKQHAICSIALCEKINYSLRLMGRDHRKLYNQIIYKSLNIWRFHIYCCQPETRWHMEKTKESKRRLHPPGRNSAVRILSFILLTVLKRELNALLSSIPAQSI